MARRPKYLPLREVAALIRDDEELVRALRHGELKARGRFCPDVETGHVDSHFSDVEPRQWDGVARFHLDSLQMENETLYEEDPCSWHSFNNIEIHADTLVRFVKSGTRPRGRPPTHNWPLLLEEAERLADSGFFDNFKSRQNICRHLFNWCETQGNGKGPEISLVRKRIKRLLDYYGILLPRA